MLPKWIVFQLTKRCNLRCEMCYEWGKNGTYSKSENLVDLDYNVIEQSILDTASAKPKYEFFGGEPLLYPKIFDVIELIKQRECMVDFPTNGFLLKKLKHEIVDSGPDCIWVSIDGPREINDKQRGNGVYNKAIEGINAIQELKREKNKLFPKIGVTTVVTNNNWQFISEFFKNDFDLKTVDFVNIELQRYLTQHEIELFSKRLNNEFNIHSTCSANGYVVPSDYFKGINFAELSRQLKDLKEICRQQNVMLNFTPNIVEANDLQNYFSGNWTKIPVWDEKCFLPWIYLEIAANGNVTTCPTFYDVSLGNVYEKKLLEIFKGDMMKKMRKSVRKELFSICYACCRHYQESQKKTGLTYN